MTKTVIARLFIKEAHIEEFKKPAEIICAKTRAEKGCISYKLFQSVESKGEFVFVEKYENQEALDIHFNSEYLESFVKAVESFQSEAMIVEVY